MRAQGPIDHPAQDIIRALQYEPYRMIYDTHCEQHKFIKKVGVGAYNVFKKTKKISLISSREFVLDNLIFEDENGTIFSIYSSNQSLYWRNPLSSGAVRGEIPVSGWVLTPQKDDPNKTWVTLINELDLGGYIPEAMISFIGRDEAHKLVKARKIMSKFYQNLQK